MEPEAAVDGCAEVIIDPALWAREMRKSWISWRSDGERSVLGWEEGWDMVIGLWGVVVVMVA